MAYRIMLSLVILFNIIIATLTHASSHSDNSSNSMELLPSIDAKTNLTIYSTSTTDSIPATNLLNMSGLNSEIITNIPGYAIVNLQTTVDFKEGVNRLFYTDIATSMDPTTVLFNSLKANSTLKVIEQDYFFDAANKDKLLEKYLGQEITVEQSQTDKIVSFTGILLNATPGEIILQDKDNKLISINQYANIRFSSIPSKIFTKPTIVWTIQSDKSEQTSIMMSYQTSGITWWGDYNAVYEEHNDGSGQLNLSSWVSIMNGSGKGYNNTDLQLVAGDLNKVKTGRVQAAPGAMMAMKSNFGAAETGFSEKQSFEYYLYTLDRKVSVPNNSTIQLALYPNMKFPVEKKYYYKGVANNPFYGEINLNRSIWEKENKVVEVYLKFTNDKASGIGVPLPAGRVRVYKTEFIGEDKINHTAVGEEVSLKLGNAFDISGKRKQTDFSVDNARHILTESFEITLKNHKDQAIEVTVVEPLNRGSNWEITDSSIPYKKIDATTVHFILPVDKSSDKTLKYTVQYTW